MSVNMFTENIFTIKLKSVMVHRLKKFDIKHSDDLDRLISSFLPHTVRSPLHLTQLDLLVFL
jgi:hypothetical protein